MNEEHPHIISLDKTEPKNRFPVLAQLGILVFIMTALFAALMFQNTKSETASNISIPAPSIDTKQYLVAPEKIEDIYLQGTAAYVWDVKAQRALYTKNSDAILPLASITKLMTTLLAHELIAEDETSTVSLSAIMQEGSSGLLVGEQMTIEELTSLALISSSNDAAYALAANVGLHLGTNDPASQFISGMNIRAKELGLNTLEFRNTTGLDLTLTVPGAVGSAKDITFLLEYIITKYPEIMSPTQQAETRVYNTTGEYHEVENTNEIVLEVPNLIGSKTGYTDLAGGNLTIAFDAGLDRPIIITVLGSTKDDRFTDVLALVGAVQKSLGKQ
ncbi:MAG: D-alanyl-D-alanine carboxypeptidase (penicillin-binding protein 5/6) [Candidatus Paceibacteria bacterium]|jgi:D-alanyl-D-alanine carboxypeptidase (penicillin-binding protein 5/6)